MWAIWNGSQDIALYLIEHGVDVLQQDTHQTTALHIALIKNANLATHLATQTEIDPTDKDIFQCNSLMQAAKQGNLELINKLAPNSEAINESDQQGTTALMQAAIMNHHLALQLLLQSGADIDICDHHGNNALIYTARNKNDQTEAAQILLESEADVKSRNNKNQTPLHIAVKQRNYHLAQIGRAHV